MVDRSDMTDYTLDTQVTLTFIIDLIKLQTWSLLLQRKSRQQTLTNHRKLSTVHFRHCLEMSIVTVSLILRKVTSVKS